MPRLPETGSLLALGALTEVAGRAVSRGSEWFLGQFVTTVAINEGTLFDIVMDWLAAHPSTRKSTRFVATLNGPAEAAPWPEADSSSVPIRIKHMGSGVFTRGTATPISRLRKLAPPPGPTPHALTPHHSVGFLPDRNARVFLHEGLWFCVRFVEESLPEHRGPGQYPPEPAPEPRRRLELSVLGRRHGYDILQDCLNALVEAHRRDSSRLTQVYVSYRGDWRRVLRRRMRPADSVVLPAGQMEDLLEDARAFLEGGAWYERMGIPHRRGWLFHGLPGTGKSSAIQAIAGALGLDLYVLRLASAEMNDGVLEDLVLRAPENAAILIEDVDAAFDDQSRAARAARYARAEAQIPDDMYGLVEPKTGILTLAGLLNVIDGVASAEGRLSFFTTNHIERLDPALIRPGRVDRRVLFTWATHDQIVRLWDRFFPLAESRWGEAFADRLAPDRVTMAQVQQHLLIHRESWETALDQAAAFLETLPAERWAAGPPTPNTGRTA